MPKTLQYPTWVSRPRDANYDVIAWGVGAANPGTSASVTVETGTPPVLGGMVLIGIVGQTGVTYDIQVGGVSQAYSTVVSRDGVGTHAEIRWQVSIPPAGGAPGATTTFTVVASSSVKFGVIVIVFNCELLNSNPNIDHTDSNVDGPGTSHLSGATGFTTSGNGSFTLAIGCPSSDPGAITYDPKFVGLPSSNGLVVYQCASRDKPNSIVSTQASFTTANSVSECTNVMATFTVKSTPDQFVTAIQPQPTTLTYPAKLPDPGWFTGPVAPVASATVPPMGWFVEQSDAPPKTKPAQPGTYSEMVDPTLFIKQKMDWYQQQPVAPPKTKVPDPGWYAHPPAIVAPPVVPPMGWYVQQPGPLNYPKRPDPGWFSESLFVIATTFTGDLHFDRIHLVGAQFNDLSLLGAQITTVQME